LSAYAYILGVSLLEAKRDSAFSCIRFNDSLGVNDDWSFDANFLRINPNAIVHAYDPTISDRHFKKQIIKRFIYLCCAKSSFMDVIEAVRLRSSYKRFFNGPARHYEERVHNRIDSVKDATFESMFQRTKSQKSFVIRDFVDVLELLDYLAPREKLQCSRTRCLTHPATSDIIPYEICDGGA
jgi:hypothetical protein